MPVRKVRGGLADNIIVEPCHVDQLLIDHGADGPLSFRPRGALRTSAGDEHADAVDHNGEEIRIEDLNGPGIGGIKIGAGLRLQIPQRHVSIVTARMPL